MMQNPLFNMGLVKMKGAIMLQGSYASCLKGLDLKEPPKSPPGLVLKGQFRPKPDSSGEPVGTNG